MSDELEEFGVVAEVLDKESADTARTRPSPSAADLLGNPDAFLTRPHLRELGLERRAIDAIFGECPVIWLPGYAKPLVQVRDFHALIERSTYCDRCGERVPP
jgi:hypothetical protein